jgi:hypothetical protein
MKEIQLTLPTSWNELSKKQLENICFQIECYHFEVKDSKEVEKETSMRLYISTAKEFLRGNTFANIKYALQEIQPKAYKEFTEFIFKKNTRTIFQESIKINGAFYYGPALRLRNVTIGELSLADSLYYNWKHSFNLAYLNALCATLYRKTDKSAIETDKRKVFDKLLVDTNTEAFVNLSYKTKLAIAYTYEGCRNNFIDTYKNIFPKKEATQQTLKNKYTPFGEIIIDKIKADPSKLKTTQNLLATDFLAIYDKDIRDLK